MIRASDFLGVVKGKYDYLFFLIADAYWLQSGRPNSFKSILEEPFARRLGRHGAVVTSFTEDIESNYRRVLKKDWPSEVRNVLENPSDPKLLIVATDFDTFNPQEDRYVIIDFREYHGDTKAFLKLKKL